MNQKNRQIPRRCFSTVASLLAVSAFSIAPAPAQVMVQPPPYPVGYGPQGAYSNQPGYPGQQYPGPQAFPQRPGAANQGPTLPDGIDALYALQGINQLVLFGTKEGYETALEIARNIDGDLDIIRTQVTLVRTTRADLAGLGVTLTGDTLTASDIAKLVAARQAGKFRALDTVRITTRENTVVDALLGEHQRGALPLTLVPRVAKDGTVAVQFTQPLDTTIVSPSGQTTVAGRAGRSDGGCLARHPAVRDPDHPAQRLPPGAVAPINQKR